MKSPALQGYVFSFLSGALVSVLGAHAYQTYLSSQRTNTRARLLRDKLRSLSGAITSTTSSNKQDPENVHNHEEEFRDANGKLIDAPELDYRLIRKAEAVIQGRTSRLIIVVERCTNDHNYSAILRTAEAFGVQNLWIIDPPKPTEGDQRNRPVVRTAAETSERVSHALFAQRAQEWLTLRTFETTKECLIALREHGYEIWVTDLSQEAVPLDEIAQVLKEEVDDETIEQESDNRRLAIVMGTEAVGCSQEMLKGAHLRVYLPLVGFADSLNLSVATALVIQYIMEFVYPACKRAMDESERQELRELWYPKLARQRLMTPRQKKDLKAMQKQIESCLRIQQKRDELGADLTKEQQLKIASLPALQARLAQANDELDRTARASVDHLLKKPPEPLGDLRRADIHRVSFVGKGTRRTHQEHWKDMAAVASAKQVVNSSRQYFQRGLDDTPA